MAKRKRGNAEGSIYHMQDGRWRAAITTGFKLNAAGKKVPKRKVITAATRHEVAEEMTKLLRDRQKGINIDPKKQTVCEYLGSWLKAIKLDVEPATFVSYEGTVRLHLVPILGDILLAKLGAQHIQQLKEEKSESIVTVGPGVKKPVEGQPKPLPRRLSASSVTYCLKVLRMALERAVELDYIHRNIALLVDFPNVNHAEIEPYSPEQAHRFIESCKANRLGALFSVALALGLRKGEALALKWSAIDFERATVNVKLTLQRVKMPGEKKGKLILKPPKRKSQRMLNLPRVCMSGLLKRRTDQEEEKRLAGTRWKDDDFVFTTKIGTPLEPRNLSRAHAEITTAAGLPHVRIHDLRHTAATLLLSQKVPARVVMELLGHSQIAITQNLYSHVVPELRKEAADQMDAALTPSKPVATSVATKPSTPTIH